MRSWNVIELAGKLTGLIVVLIGSGVYLLTEHAEAIVFSTGVLLYLGGAGAGLSERRLPRPPEPPPGGSP